MMLISDCRNDVQSNHPSNQNEKSNGSEIISKSDGADANKAKDKEPFKSETI